MVLYSVKVSTTYTPYIVCDFHQQARYCLVNVILCIKMNTVLLRFLHGLIRPAVCCIVASLGERFHVSACSVKYAVAFNKRFQHLTK